MVRRKDVRDALIVVLAAMTVCPERFRDVFNDMGLPRSAWEALAREWIFNERHRLILADRLFNGTTYERLAEKYDLSTQHVKK